MRLLRPRILSLIAPNLLFLNSMSDKISKLLKVSIQSNGSSSALAAAGTTDVNMHVVDSLTLLATGFIEKAGVLDGLVAGPASVVWAI